MNVHSFLFAQLELAFTHHIKNNYIVDSRIRKRDDGTIMEIIFFIYDSIYTSNLSKLQKPTIITLDDTMLLGN